MTMESKLTIRLTFMWKEFAPDVRAYKPSTPVIDTATLVGVDVPLTHEFVLNSAEIIQAQISAEDEPTPILTPLGMRYCIDQFEAVMINPTSDVQNGNSEWDDGETETSTNTDEWEDAPAETKTKDDVDWDESWEE